MARKAYELTTEDFVQYINAETLEQSRKQITSIEWLHGTQVFIQLKGIKGTFSAEPFSEFVFPRRQDGTLCVHKDPAELQIRDLYVGDLVPPEEGWKTANNGMTIDLSMAREILQIFPYKSPSTGIWLGWRIVLKQFGNTFQKMVSLQDPRLYGEGSSTYLPFSKPVVENKLVKVTSNASGAYKHKKTEEITTFRIAGKAGRPPLLSRPIPEDPKEWDNWEFIGPGQRHLSEVMYRKNHPTQEKKETKDAKE